MRNDLIRYDASIDNDIIHQPNLDDLSGTINDIGQLIAYLRDLSRDLVPLTNSLVPLADNLNDFIENYPKKLENFFSDNPLIAVGGIAGISLIFGFLGTGIAKNIIEINRKK